MHSNGFGKQFFSEPNPCLELRLILLDLRTSTYAGFRNPSDLRHTQACQLVDHFRPESNQEGVYIL